VKQERHDIDQNVDGFMLNHRWITHWPGDYLAAECCYPTKFSFDVSAIHESVIQDNVKTLERGHQSGEYLAAACCDPT
jgi:hypothetical protein